MFSFQTVFYQTHYSYRYCRCAFDHEYLRYLSDTGEKVNIEIYERVANNIETGKCPHVEHVPVEHLRETGIFGIHIAAAVGNEAAVKYHIENNHQRRGLIFQLTPNDIAVFKSRSHITNLHFCCNKNTNRFSLLSDPVAYIRCLDENCDKITIGKDTRFEVYIRQRQTPIVNDVIFSCLDAGEDFINAWKYIMKHKILDYVDYFETFLRNHADSDRGLYSFKFPCMEAAIVYNEPTTLQRLLSNHSLSSSTMESEMKSSLSLVCLLLDRHECKSVLVRNRSFRKINISSKDVATKLLSLLFSYENCLDEFVAAFETQQLNLEKESSQMLLNSYMASLNVYRALISLGVNVNFSHEPNKTALLFLIKACRQDPGNVHRKMQLLINENPETNMHKTVVSLGLENAFISKDHSLITVMAGEYYTDAKQHGLHGFDDGDSFCLNFIGPYLMECGFPISRNNLMASLNAELHPSVRLYIQNYLESSRPLKMICRNVLRKNFKGSTVHEYMTLLKCPLGIKDFVLLKPLVYANQALGKSHVYKKRTSDIRERQDHRSPLRRFITAIAIGLYKWRNWI